MWGKLWSLIKSAIVKVFQCLKKNLWYSFLLVISSVYVFIYRYNIDKLSEFNAVNLIFILWLILLGFPLFTEIEIGNIKLKKEIEETRKEVKESIRDLKFQIMDVKVSNSPQFNNYYAGPLPSTDELSQMSKQVETADPIHSDIKTEFGVSNDNIYLFQVRLSIEKQLSSLSNLFQFGERKTMHAMVQFLIEHEVIEYKTAKLIREIINIANRGIHGEIVDSNYIDFVRKTYPKVKAVLDNAQDFYINNEHYYVCYRCGYQGPSKYRYKCPKCGFVSDDE